MNSTEQKKFDLHMHSNCSDGYDDPATVAQTAAGQGLKLMALTDHDSIAGVAEAQAAAKALGLPYLPALEMDTEWTSELHILGIGIDPENRALNAALETARMRREERNAGILEKLKKAGYDIAPYLKRSAGTVTRMHIAFGLMDAGYAHNLKDAFSDYLVKGKPGYYRVERFTPQEVIAIIRDAGGIPVWAHPFHADGNIHALAEQLVEWGLAGIEAYHPSATEGQSRILLSIACQKKLMVTCGSDSHGKNRPGVTIGCTWKNTPELTETFDYLFKRAQKIKSEEKPNNN